MATSTKVHPIRGKKKATKNVPREDIKDKIYERVAREEKAYRIVERLIDNPVSFNLLTKCIKYLNQSVYNDIVEERSITKSCGYPLCEKTLPVQIRKQMYSIDARINKVYKLEERVKFCSALCFRYSRNLGDQLSPEPVWLIPKSAYRNIVITPLSDIPLSLESEELPKNQKIDEKYLIENSEIPKGKDVLEKQHIGEPRPARTLISKEPNILETLHNQFSWLDVCDEDEDTENLKHFPKLSFLGSIRESLVQWKTAASCVFISEPEPLNHDVDIDDTDDYLLDDDLRLFTGHDSKAPLPHFSELVTEKVVIMERESEKLIVLPKIDSINVEQQRQNLLLVNLKPSIDNILGNIKLSYSDASAVLIKLVSLLNIGSRNCMFSEKQCQVLSCVLLHAVYPYHNALKDQFRSIEPFETFLVTQIKEIIVEENGFAELCKVFVSQEI